MNASSPNASSPPEKGLPAVTPPSGRFIAQLFLVPGLIVAVAVLLILAFNYLVAPANTSEHYLKRIDDTNPDVRWRGASDLAQVLKRKESIHLRSDAKFALDLCQRLRTALDDLVVSEKATAEAVTKASDADKAKAWKKLEARRNHVRFLAAALGDFVIPAGLPLLGELALRNDSPDDSGNTLLRRQSVWAIGNLGQNTKAFKQLAADKQGEVISELESAASASGKRADWAKTALHYLGRKQPNVVPADAILAKCAQADDRYLRAQVALALNSWEGELIEPTLLRLARDSGHGSTPRIAED